MVRGERRRRRRTGKESRDGREREREKRSGRGWKEREEKRGLTLPFSPRDVSDSYVKGEWSGWPWGDVPNHRPL